MRKKKKNILAFHCVSSAKGIVVHGTAKRENEPASLSYNYSIQQLYCPVKDTVLCVTPPVNLAWWETPLTGRTRKKGGLLLNPDGSKSVRMWRGRKGMALTGQTNCSIL